MPLSDRSGSRSWAAVAAVLLLGGGCAGRIDVGNDAGVTNRVDAGAATGIDAGVTSRLDAGMTTRTDAGATTANDAGTATADDDAGTTSFADAGTTGADAGPTPDAAHLADTGAPDASEPDDASTPIDSAVGEDAGGPARTVAVTWDPLMDGTYDTGGELCPPDPHIERAGAYLENWSVDQYGRPGAAITPSHTHLYPWPWDPPDTFGNPTTYENQHAFGRILHGIYVRLTDHGAFDLVSIDYRTRHDDDPEHVSDIPGANPANVEIWISDTLDLGVPPARGFRRYPTGMPFNVAMDRWSTLRPTELTNVTGIYITTTGNVSIDNVVLRPR